MNFPDEWIIFKIENSDDPIYKLFAVWHGGYAGADYWKLNSGISSLTIEGNMITVHGFSGSCYTCDLRGHGVKSFYGTSILNQFISSLNNKKIPVSQVEVTQLSTLQFN